jgi:hypothetical protein
MSVLLLVHGTMPQKSTNKTTDTAALCGVRKNQKEPMLKSAVISHLPWF